MNVNVKQITHDAEFKGPGFWVVTNIVQEKGIRLTNRDNSYNNKENKQEWKKVTCGNHALR